MINKKQYFKQIYEQSKDKIYRLCLGFMGNNADADDLFQEVLIKIWNNLEAFRKESNINTWIYRITTNTALLTLKRKNKFYQNQKKYKPIKSQSEIDNSEPFEKELQVKKLYTAISTLKEIDRIIISLVLENCSYNEIASITGLKASNIGARINRTKKILYKKLK